MKYLIVVIMAIMMQACMWNFHEVQKGVLYRSNQPSMEDILEVVPKYGIKTILNLRGEKNGSEWYEEEKTAVQMASVILINISMSASKLPHRDAVRKLIEVFDTANYPIWIHCQGGADRTGEAVAIFMMEYLQKSKEYAMKQGLTWKKFHFKWRYPAKDYFIEELWQGREWAMNEYDPCVYEYPQKYYDKEQLCQY